MNKTKKRNGMSKKGFDVYILTEGKKDVDKKRVIKRVNNRPIERPS